VSGANKSGANKSGAQARTAGGSAARRAGGMSSYGSARGHAGRIRTSCLRATRRCREMAPSWRWGRNLVNRLP